MTSPYRAPRALVLAMLALSFSPLFGDTQPAPQTQTASAEAVAASNYKDQFLGFVLQKAEKYSGKAEDALGVAVDQAQKEAPVLAKQYLEWKLVENALGIGFPFVFFAVCGPVFLFHLKKYFALCRAENSRDKDARYPWNPEVRVQLAYRMWLLLPSGIIGALSFIGTLCNLSCLVEIAEIYFAPHVYLIEQASKLVHG